MTGSLFEPLLARDWQVVGSDLLSGMLDEAARKFGSAIQLHELDARDLPPISPGAGHPEEGVFDLVLLLNDVINYMTEFSASGLTEKASEGGWEWRGLNEGVESEGVYEARLSGRGVETHVHRQRHWPPERMTAALAGGGSPLLRRARPARGGWPHPALRRTGRGAGLEGRLHRGGRRRAYGLGGTCGSPSP